MLSDFFIELSNYNFYFFNSPKDDFSFLPITVIFAIIIFLVKELIEFIKRRGERKRKIFSMKRMFSRECERNLWTITLLREALSVIDSGYKDKKKLRVEFSEYKSDYVFIYEDSDDNSTRSGHPITETHRELLDGNLMEAAVLDKTLFNKLENACDALAELEHVRDSFLKIEITSKEIGNNLMEGFVGYGLEELEPIQESLNDLYIYCTGRELKDVRLR